MTHKSIETAPKTGEKLALWKHGYKENGWVIGYWCFDIQRWVSDSGHMINPEFYMELENPMTKENKINSLLEKLSILTKREDEIMASKYKEDKEKSFEIDMLWSAVTTDECSLLARYMCGGKS